MPLLWVIRDVLNLNGTKYIAQKPPGNIGRLFDVKRLSVYVQAGYLFSKDTADWSVSHMTG